jgi:soluble lytic murein transglycosylase
MRYQTRFALRHTLIVISALLLPALSHADGRIESQRLAYDRALVSIEKQQWAVFQQLEPGLRSYILYPYVRQAYLNQTFASASDEDLARFVTEHSDLPFVARLKDRWLTRLASEGKWALFDQHYLPGDRNASQDCRRAMHQWDLGDRAGAMQQARTLWTVGRSQPNACDPLFERWRAAGGLTDEIVWQRIRLALLYRQDALARYLTKLMQQNQALATLFVDTATQPAKLADADRYRGLPASKMADIATVSLRRMGRDDASGALALWPHYRDLPYSDEDRLAITRDIGVRLAKKIDPAALPFMAANDPRMQDDDVSEWRVRLALRTRQWDTARQLTEQLPASLAEQSRWRYWRLRSTQLSSSSAGELVSEYKSLAQERDFYGFLAAERARQPYALNHQRASVADEVMRSVQQDPGILRAREFLDRNDVISARREWYHAGERFNREQLIAQAVLANDMAWYFPAIRGVSQAQYWDDLDIRFPMAYQQPIQDQARARQINSTWVYAITRQESAFMADARSHAGAMGLMQLMPATARETARRYAIPYSGNHDALIPERNIALGAAYLSGLSQQFRGNRVLASAAYNAGPGRVRQWTRDMGSLPADVWIESIPFDETRKYVQSVLSYAVIYGQKLGIQQPVMEQHERYLEP